MVSTDLSNNNTAAFSRASNRERSPAEHWEITSNLLFSRRFLASLVSAAQKSFLFTPEVSEKYLLTSQCSIDSVTHQEERIGEGILSDSVSH